MKTTDVTEKILIILFIILAVIFVIQMTLKLSGNSPTDTQTLYVGFGVILSYLLITSYNLGKFIGKVTEFMSMTKKSFERVREDISRLRK